VKENSYSDEDIEYMNLQWSLMTEKQRNTHLRNRNIDGDDPGVVIMGVGLGLSLIMFALRMLSTHPIWVISCVCGCVFCYGFCKKLQSQNTVHVETLGELRQRVLARRYVDCFRGKPAARQHVNPDGSLGGYVADTAHVDATSYVHPYAFICDTAQVLGNSSIRQWSIVKNKFVIKDAILKEYHINGKFGMY